MNTLAVENKTNTIDTEDPAKTAAKQHEEDLRRLRRLRPIDDDFMRCLFKDNLPLAEFVLRILTGKPDLSLTSCETQRDMKRLAGARSVCLDAYGTDLAGTKYDLEIERSDKGADPHRARYHSSVMNVENLRPRQEFKELPETYTIFITEKDFFGKGEPVYPVERINLATGEAFGDGEHILYVNGEYRGDSDLGKLMHDFNCTDAGAMNFPLMVERTKYLKENPKGVSEVCRVMEEMRDEYLQKGIQQGIQKGIQQGKKEGIKQGKMDGIKEGTMNAAKRMLLAGKYALEEIANISGLPLDEVKQLQAGG